MQTTEPTTDALVCLLIDAGARGVELAADPADVARLRHRPAPLPPDLAARLRLHKGRLLAMLCGEDVPDQSDSASEDGYVMGERLGIADGLGMPTHRGAPAWLIAASEAMRHSCPMATDGVD